MSHERLKEEFMAAYDAYGDALFRFCFSKTSDREVAKDLVQEVFTRFWTELCEGRKMSHTRGFLYRVARNLVIDWYRKAKSLSLEEREEGGEHPKDAAHEAIFDHAEVEHILGLMDELDPAYREIIVMRYVDEIPPREIAEILGESVNAVSTRITRARQELEHILKYGKE